MKNDGTNLIWYRQGAVSWNEALPLGNGRLGAMVYGDPVNERVGLNEDTLWSGYPQFHDSPRACEAYKQAQQLVMDGQNAEAQRVLEQQFTNRPSQVYLTLGDLLLQAFMRFVRIRRRAVTGSEIEAGQPILAGFLATCDAVEAVLHIRGELVVHVLREVRFQEFDHGERQPRWNQRPAALIHVAAVDDGGNNARVG